MRRAANSTLPGCVCANELHAPPTNSPILYAAAGQDDVKKLRRENDQLRRELWGLRDEYDKLEALLKRKRHGDGDESEVSEAGRGDWPSPVPSAASSPSSL